MRKLSTLIVVMLRITGRGRKRGTKNMVCSLDKGLACYPTRQGKGCQDYKIRYLRECFGGDGSLISTTAAPTTTTTIMIWPTPPRRHRGPGHVTKHCWFH